MITEIVVIFLFGLVMGLLSGDLSSRDIRSKKTFGEIKIHNIGQDMDEPPYLQIITEKQADDFLKEKYVIFKISH